MPMAKQTSQKHKAPDHNHEATQPMVLLLPSIIILTIAAAAAAVVNLPPAGSHGHSSVPVQAAAGDQGESAGAHQGGV